MLNALASAGAPLFPVYRERIDSVFKLFHWPRTIDLIQSRHSSQSRVVSPELALELAIIFSAVCTLTCNECPSILGRSREESVATYRAALQVALNALELPKNPSIMKLQALTLYLVSVPQFPVLEDADVPLDRTSRL